jgi:hypothetical protein
MTIPAILPVLTITGRYDAYCHVCWFVVWRLWVGEFDPGGRCVYGITDALKCPDAMQRARQTAMVCKAEGSIP